MIARVLAIVVLAVLVLAGYTGYQALQVKNGLQTVADEAQPAVQDLQSGDVAALRRRLGTVQDGAAQAARNSQGPGWWLASRLPGVGYDVQAIRTVSEVSDRLASGVLPQVVAASTKVARINPYDGPPAIQELRNAAASLERADKRLRRQEARVAAIDVHRLDPRLGAPVKQLQVALAAATDFMNGKVGQAEQALSAVPSGA